PVAHGPGDQLYSPVPIVLAGNASTGLDLAETRGSRRKRIVQSLRPLVSRSDQPNDLGRLQQGTDRRADHWPAAREVFMELQRINKLCVVIHLIAQHADIQMLGVRWEHPDWLAT